MSSLWICSVVVFLCCNSQLEVVLAGNKTFGPKILGSWIGNGDGYNVGKGEAWESGYSDSKNVLKTDITKDGGIDGESWFITPVLKKSNIFYLAIEARPTKCDKQSTCDLIIYGTTETIRSSQLPVPSDSKKRDFIKKRGFESILQLTFPKSQSKTTLVTSSVITKPYQRLAIFTEKTSGKVGINWEINSIKLYYYFCESTTIRSINVKQTNSSATNVNVPALCSNNAVAKDGSESITVQCSAKGEWIVGKDQKCSCNEGFGFNTSKCSPCQKDHYKGTISDTQCLKCPSGKTNNTNRTECHCKRDHYICKDESVNGSCYGLPSPVGELEINVTSNTSVHITWSEPAKNDDDLCGTITYSVECYQCHQSNQSRCDTVAKDAMFSPNKTNVTTTYVNVNNLTTNTTYKFKVVSRNSFLKNVPVGKWRYNDKTYTPVTTVTTAAPPTSSTTTSTTSTTSALSSTREVPVNDTTTKAGVDGTNSGNNKENNNKTFIFIGGGVGFLALLLIILIVVIRSRKSKSNKEGSENFGFESVALPTIGQRMYVDPSNYDDPEAAVKDFANEISPKSLILERVLGGGEFGDVYKGTLKTQDGGVLDVAAKTLKHDSDERSRKDFFMEASAMGQFDDPNVIHLEGVITKSVPHMIVTEYMSNGSLDHFLKLNDENLTDLQLVGMARGVASGMNYLAAMHFVHRDLAARNVLVTDTLLCKVADFGLSRELETDDSSRGEYCTSGGKIPVRWTAPESIKYRKFSTASDVWSYGILLWEIMAFAERPYWDWDNFKVLERVDEGYRLPAPKNCPKAVHDLMLLCWETDRSLRPEFADIVRMLDDWIRSPETIRYQKINSMHRPGSGTINDPAILIKQWLTDIKMNSYIPHFTQAGFRQLSDLAGLLDSDLQAIGVNLIGHRNKMLRTIRSLPITDESKKSPWNRATSFKI